MDTIAKDTFDVKDHKYQRSYHPIPHCFIPFPNFPGEVLVAQMLLPSGIGSDVKSGGCYLYTPDPLVRKSATEHILPPDIYS